MGQTVVGLRCDRPRRRTLASARRVWPHSAPQRTPRRREAAGNLMKPTVETGKWEMLAIVSGRKGDDGFGPRFHAPPRPQPRADTVSGATIGRAAHRSRRFHAPPRPQPQADTVSGATIGRAAHRSRRCHTPPRPQPRADTVSGATIGRAAHRFVSRVGARPRPRSRNGPFTSRGGGGHPRKRYWRGVGRPASDR